MKPSNLPFLITLLRGIFALSLGVALLLNPEKRLPVLGNFMGVYWLTSGLLSVRWGFAGERPKGFPLLAGMVGILAGLVMLSRQFITRYIAGSVFFYLLGTVILLTGLMHIFGGFRKSEDDSRQRSITSVLMGIFEVILGVLLMVAPLERGSGIYLAAGVWAFLSGIVLIGDAMRIRRQISKTPLAD